MRFLALLLVWNAQGATFYTDSAWPGSTHTGAPQTPWTTVDWAKIDSTLAAEDVTVICPARIAGSDTHGTYGVSAPAGLDMTKRTDASGHTLTIDGSSFYNTSIGTPNWVPYTGTNRCWFNNVNSQDCNHVRHSNIRVHGIQIVQSGANKIISIAGDNWIVEQCDLSATSNASDGPGLYVVPTADSAHEGSSCWTPRCTNIVIRNCVIHDTQGEAIYVGGGGSSPGTSGSGYPAHSQITIVSNVIYNAGVRGGQGDGIDQKGGITKVTISANTIGPLTDPGNNGIRGLVMQGQLLGVSSDVVIERNTFTDITGEDASIAIEDSWGQNGNVTLRNNVIKNSNHGSGIRIYTTQGPVFVYCNTIVGNAGLGLETFSGSTVDVRDNLFIGNNGAGSEVSLGGTVAAFDYNGYSTPLGTTPGTHSFATTAAATFVSASDLHLKAGSSAIAKGLDLSSTGFVNDKDDRQRPAGAWDAGAYQSGTVPPPTQVPGPPSNFVALPGNNTVNLVWQAPLSDGGSPVTGYRVLRGTSPGAEIPLATVQGVVYSDTSAVNGTRWFFVVRAINVNGEGTNSAELFVTPP